jgi:hypothetical protein
MSSNATCKTKTAFSIGTTAAGGTSDQWDLNAESAAALINSSFSAATGTAIPVPWPAQLVPFYPYNNFLQFTSAKPALQAKSFSAKTPATPGLGHAVRQQCSPRYASCGINLVGLW